MAPVPIKLDAAEVLSFVAYLGERLKALGRITKKGSEDEATKGRI